MRTPDYLQTRVGNVAKPELGTKRLCGGCGTKYYDLNRDPITCPKCGTVFIVAQAMRAKTAAKAAVVEEDEDDVELDDEGAEMVSLEEADAETEGDTAVAIDDDEVDEEIGDDDADDVFIDDEDEEDGDVPGIVLERDDEDTDR